ncbi:Inorganic pyrophosphatase mitochondrial [Spathaspora sp. JA1]|nr:Inorganic pyrophosphatase mitochondrial [Spathaspora sp. JA1]
MATSNARALSRLNLTQQHLSPRNLSSITNVNQGTKYTLDFKNYAVDANNKVVSYFHDIPLDLNVHTREANIVVEIPRWTNAKFEISRDLPGNPIVQDCKNGKVRFVKNLFPHHGYIHNYGAFPQTWEDPSTQHVAGLYGDNDPVDVCEIGSRVFKTGDIKRVKILGSIALIDDGELDWKVIVVDVEDPLAKEVYDIHHLYTKCPGLLETTRQWFQDYKLPDGKPANEFAFNAVYKNARDTIDVIKQCHQSWQALIHGQNQGGKFPNIANTRLKDTPGYVERLDVELNNPEKPDAEIPVEIQKSYFMTLN